MDVRNTKIASPCSAKWEQMEGDERSRHCKQCKLSVHNLSAMTVQEANALLAEKNGQLCVRLYRRDDGTVMTQDCPVGASKVKKRAQVNALWFRAAFASAIVGLLPSWGWLKSITPDATSPKSCSTSNTNKPNGGGWETGIFRTGS